MTAPDPFQPPTGNGISNLRVTRQSADKTEVVLTMDYSYDGFSGPAALVLPIIEKRGGKSISAWFGADPVIVGRGRGPVSVKVKFFNDEVGVPSTFTSDRVRILILNQHSTSIVASIPFFKTISWGTPRVAKLRERPASALRQRPSPQAGRSSPPKAAGDARDQLAEESSAREQTVAQIQARAEEAKRQIQAEEQARLEEQKKLRAEAEARARREAYEQALALEAKTREEEEAKRKAQAEEQARLDEQKRLRAEAEAKAKREAQGRALTSAAQISEEETSAQAKAEEQARLEEQKKLRAEADARAKRDAQERAQALEARTRLEEEARRKARAEEQARLEEEKRIQAEADVRARREAEEQALAAQAKAREEEESKRRAQAEEQARLEAQKRMRAEAEALAKEEKALAQAQAPVQTQNQNPEPAYSPASDSEAKQLRTRVTHVDVVNRSLDGTQLTIGVEFEYRDKIGPKPMLGVEVTRSDDPSASQYFHSQPVEIGRSRRNFLLFPIRFQPPADIDSSGTYSTDKVVVYLADSSNRKRFNLFPATMLLMWRSKEVPAMPTETVSSDSLQLEEFTQTEPHAGYITVAYHLASGPGQLRARLYDSANPASATWFECPPLQVREGHRVQILEVSVKRDLQITGDVIKVDTLEVELLDSTGKVVERVRAKTSMKWSKPS
jgi:hypothetical protein